MAAPTIGILMSPGPDAVTEACAGLPAAFVDAGVPGDLARHLPGLDALIVSNDFYTPEVASLLEHAPRLRWLQSSSTGYENLDALGAPRRLAVTQPGPLYSEIVAEHGVAMLLALARGVLPMERQRQRRLWDRPAIVARMVSLKDRELLAVGFGEIGRGVARRVRPFGMTVAAWVRRRPLPEVAGLADRIVMADGLHAALATADAVVVGVPLVPATRRLIDAAALAAMKPGAFLINLARGPVVDEAALVVALQEGRLGGAGLDVFEEEPLPEASPLWGMDNVIVSPHLSAFGDGHGARAFGRHIRENVRRFLAGEPLLNPVDGYPDRA
jgi:phosphoglycerate dehydrogenase-like enzyme